MSEKDKSDNKKIEELPKPTEEEIKAARKFIKSCITKRERIKIYAWAIGDAILKAGNPLANKFASGSYGAAMGSQGAESASAVSGNFFGTRIGQLCENINMRVRDKIMRHYDQRPGMEQKLQTYAAMQNYAEQMGMYAGNYMRYNTQRIAAGIGALAGLGVTGGALFKAGLTWSGVKVAAATAIATGTMPIAPVVAVGALGAIVAGQHWLQGKVKQAGVIAKPDITNKRNSLISKQLEMFGNSRTRRRTNSNDVAYEELNSRSDAVRVASNKFLGVLNKYGASFDLIKCATGAVTMYVANAARLAAGPVAALGYGAATMVSAANAVSSAKKHREEAQEIFATVFRQYARGITDFVWGKEKLRTHCSALEIDKISYRYRSSEEADFGKYRSEEVFNSSQKISFGPGITSLSGASGSGKSTLIELLFHEDHVPSGAIRIGNISADGKFSGQDYRSLACGEVNKNMAYATSMPEISTGTVDDYIRMGNPRADESKVQAIKNLLEIETEYFDDKEQEIKPLTLTMAGNKSGGQLARLSLAQALIQDSQIMILDEVTSPLDHRLSEKVCNHLKKLGDEGKTIIYITHKPEELNILKPYQNVDVGKHEEGQQINDIRQYPITNDEELQARIEFQRSRKATEDKAKKEAEERAKQETEGKIQTSMDKVKEHILANTENTKENPTNSDDYAKIISLNFPHAKSTQNNTEQNQLQAKIISFSSGGRP